MGVVEERERGRHAGKWAAELVGALGERGPGKVDWRGAQNLCKHKHHINEDKY